MLTKDDLHAIGELIKAENKPLKEAVAQIRNDMVTKPDLEANNKVIGTIVRAEIGAVKQELVKLGEKIAKRLNDQDEQIEKIKNALHVSKN